MKNPLISIIIPAFNVESFISNSINSVLRQTYNNIEIIIVNDGSTDNTLNVIENMAGKNKNIIVLSQINKGISSARNLGLSKSTGEYISFLDSDDSIEPIFIESMLKKNEEENSDVVFCLNRTIGKNKNIKLSKNYEDMNKLAVNYMNFDYFDICCMLIKRSFLLDFNLTFDEKLIVGEDVLFILMCINKTNFSCVPKYLYNYIYRECSIMNKKWGVNDHINEIQAWDAIYHKMYLDYRKTDRNLLMDKIGAKVLNLKVAFMWKLLASGKFNELSNFISTLSYYSQYAVFLRKKELFKLNLINSKNKKKWFLVRLILTKKKDIIQ
ncbi:capsular polysaccharide biosynthesis protein CpsI [Xenorhabdus vietnamensis]|uniref:Capsular polysaccharide biosynthesis protein CpsI n=1 Tax=Xenorhabdus vietnamensis TaxID=351656 RepID=A0A1Y2SCB0_9GAMM|nr:glycosyltransferase family 2 protein [Xenorhabdus vietnamensis]OTA15395.1 capsular polysaccharide biosynthesis protein CpsI [Xenorhabdus vietnamensis]